MSILATNLRYKWEETTVTFWEQMGSHDNLLPITLGILIYMLATLLMGLSYFSDLLCYIFMVPKGLVAVAMETECSSIGFKTAEETPLPSYKSS